MSTGKSRRAHTSVNLLEHASSERRGCESTNPIGIREAQDLVTRSLTAVKADAIVCALAQPELISPSLTGLGFVAVEDLVRLASDYEAMRERFGDVEAILIVALGAEVALVAQVLAQWTARSCDLPALLVVMMLPFANLDPVELVDDSAVRSRGVSPWMQNTVDSKADMRLAEEAVQIRQCLNEAGADDALCLHSGEKLEMYRVMEVVQNRDWFAKKANDMADLQVSAMLEDTSRKMKVAYGRFLSVLPGRVLEFTPEEEAGQVEAHAEDGSLCGVREYTFKSVLGSGGFGRVYHAESHDRTQFAIKVIQKTCLKNANLLFSLDRELSLLQNLPSHPHVIGTVGVVHTQSNFFIIMPYTGKMHLQKFTKTYLANTGGAPSLPGNVAAKFASQMTSAVAHVHELRICHRDLKPENWVVDDGQHVLRLADFGLAVQVTSAKQRLRKSCGSLPFCAPEVFECEDDYDGLAADVWSLALNFAELLGGPYSIEKLLGWVPRHPNDIADIVNGLRSLPRRLCPPGNGRATGVRESVERMLVLDPPDRCRIGDVVLRSAHFGSSS